MSPETLPCSELLLKRLFFKLLPNIFYCVKTYDNLTKMMTPMKFSTLWSSSHLRGVSATKLLSAAAEIWSLHSELYDSFLHFMAEMLMIAIMIAGNRYDLNSVQSSIWFPYFAHRPPRYKTLWKSWLSSHVDPDFMSNKAPLQFVSAMIYYLARKSAWMPHFWQGVNTWLPDLWLFCTSTDI